MLGKVIVNRLTRFIIKYYTSFKCVRCSLFTFWCGLWGRFSTRRDEKRQLYYIFARDTLMTDLAPQVAEANRGEPGTIKIKEIC